MTIGNILGIARAARTVALPSALPDVRRLIGLPGFPAVATAATIAAKLRGLAELDARAPGLSGERLSMMALGLFIFGVDTLAFAEFQRKQDWRHGSADRFAAMPASQYLGPGKDSISLPGVLIPELGGNRAAIDNLRTMAGAGDAYPLVESSGVIIGQFVISSIDEKRDAFMPGGAPRRVEFGIDLLRVA